MTPTEQLISDCANRMVFDFDGVMLTALRLKLAQLGERLPDDVHQLQGRLQLVHMTDGREVLSVDGQPFLESWPLEFDWHGAGVTIQRKYRAL